MLESNGSLKSKQSLSPAQSSDHFPTQEPFPHYKDRRQPSQSCEGTGVCHCEVRARKEQ